MLIQFRVTVFGDARSVTTFPINSNHCASLSAANQKQPNWCGTERCVWMKSCKRWRTQIYLRHNFWEKQLACDFLIAPVLKKAAVHSSGVILQSAISDLSGFILKCHASQTKDKHPKYESHKHMISAHTQGNHTRAQRKVSETESLQQFSAC